MLADLLMHLAERTHNKARAAAIWYVPNRGWLGCLLDDHMQQLSGTTTWDYHDDVDEVALALANIALRLQK